MASPTAAPSASATNSSLAVQATPVQGALASAGAGITGGYTGSSESLKIIIALLLGVSLYNAIELVTLILVTFNKYHGLYFWSLIVAGLGVIPYALGFLIKFFQLLDPNADSGYVAVVLLTIGWWTMVTGQAVVLWSRLHLLTNSRRVLRYTLYMIITDAIIFHIPTTILTFGSNSNTVSQRTLTNFVKGYSIMEKIQMVGFFLQECVLSVIYIKETLRLLKLSESVSSDFTSPPENETYVKQGRQSKKVMYQLIAINAIIIAMDVALLAVEFANLYLIETTLKGVVYSIKLKLEFAVLGKLVQIVHYKSDSSHSAFEMRTYGTTGTGTGTGTGPGRDLERKETGATMRTGSCGDITRANGRLSFGGGALGRTGPWPDFVDQTRINGDVTHAFVRLNDYEREGMDIEKRKRRRRSWSRDESWIEEELDKHNIG